MIPLEILQPLFGRQVMGPPPEQSDSAAWFHARRPPSWLARQVVEACAVAALAERSRAVPWLERLLAELQAVLAATFVSPPASTGLRHHLEKARRILERSGHPDLATRVSAMLETPGATGTATGRHPLDLAGWLENALRLRADLDLEEAAGLALNGSRNLVARALDRWMPGSDPAAALARIQEFRSGREVREPDFRTWLSDSMAYLGSSLPGADIHANWTLLPLREIPGLMWRRWFHLPALRPDAPVCLVVDPAPEPFDVIPPVRLVSWRLVHDCAHLLHLGMLHREGRPDLAAHLACPPYIATAEGFAMASELGALRSLWTGRDDTYERICSQVGAPVELVGAELSMGLLDRSIRLAMDVRVHAQGVAYSDFLAEVSERAGVGPAYVESVTREWLGLPGMGALYMLSLTQTERCRREGTLPEVLHFRAERPPVRAEDLTAVFDGALER
jgi:hypothetical protein